MCGLWVAAKAQQLFDLESQDSKNGKEPPSSQERGSSSEGSATRVWQATESVSGRCCKLLATTNDLPDCALEPGLALSKAPTALVSGLLAASHNGVRPKWSRTFGVHGHFQPVEASELPYSTQYLSAKHIEREQPRPGAISVDLHRPKHSGAAICRRHPRRLCRSCPLKISSDLSTYRQQVKETSTSTPLHQEGILDCQKAFA